MRPPMPASLVEPKEPLRPKPTRHSRGNENPLNTVGSVAADFKGLAATKLVDVTSRYEYFLRTRIGVDPGFGLSCMVFLWCTRNPCLPGNSMILLVPARCGS